MEFRTGVKRYDPPLCQPSGSSRSVHTSQSLLVYGNKSQLEKTTTTLHSHTGGGIKPNRLQQVSWAEMPRDILIKIFKLLPFQHALHVWFYPLVCKSWLYAAVDIVYPPCTTVIDLRFLSKIPSDLEQRLRFMVYLKLVLDTRPQTQWTALYLPENTGFSKDDILYIAQRTPCLQYLDWPFGEFYFRRHWEAIISWKNLKGIDLGPRIGYNFLKSLPCSFAYYFKNLRSLGLVGHRFGVEEVSEFIKALFPQLEYFSLQDACLTMDAASLLVSEVVATNNINNNHEVGIQTLDLRHCVFVSSHFGYTDSVVKQSLVEVEIHEKVAAAIKTYLRCEGHELCSQCKVKHNNLLWSLNLPQRQNQEKRSSPPTNHQSPLGTTKRRKGLLCVRSFSGVSSWAENGSYTPGKSPLGTTKRRKGPLCVRSFSGVSSWGENGSYTPGSW